MLKITGFLGILLLFACSGRAAPAVIAEKARIEPVIDGVPEEPCWANAFWIALDACAPAIPQTAEEMDEMCLIAGGGARKQLRQQVKGAVLWSERGLFFAFIVEDADLIAHMEEGDCLWIEDVVEVFLAGEARTDAPFVEIQLSPANKTFIKLTSSSETGFRRPETATAMDGTLNDNTDMDRGWTAELFIPWDELLRTGVAVRPEEANDGKIAAIRLAGWDLSGYSRLRLNRYTAPGTEEPLDPQYYRPLICRDIPEARTAD